MQSPSTREDYGAPFTDALPIEDPTTEQSATQFNALALHAAQMSQTSAKVYLRFPTVASGDSTPSQTRTHWGDTSSQFPTTVTRSGTGTYVITYPSTMNNQASEDETVSFICGKGQAASSTVYGHVQVSGSGAVMTVTVWDAAGALVDVTAGTSIDVWLW